MGQGMGIPRMGVIGSAWSTVAARAVAGVLCLAWGLGKGHLRGKLLWLIPQGKTVIELMRIGMWNNGQVAARGIAGGIMIRTIQEAGGGNPNVVGGVFVGLKVELMLILMAFGWGAAAQTLVATSLGAGKRERAGHQERLTIVFSLLLGIGLTIPLFVFVKEIAALFNPQPELVQWAKIYIQIMAVGFITMPVNIVISQAMIARDKLKTPVITDSIVLLGIMSPAMIIAALAGAGVKVIIIINVVVNVGLTIVYIVIRLRGRDHRNATNHAQQQERGDPDGNPQQDV